MEVTPDGLARFFEVVLPHLNEVQRRVVAGASAAMLGRGGKSWVAEASGMSRNTVIKAEGEVVAGIEPQVSVGSAGPSGHARKPDVVAEVDVEVDRETGWRVVPARVHGFC